MTLARRRSLLVGVLLAVAASLVALAVIRAIDDGSDEADARLTEPGGVQQPGIATQGEVVGNVLPPASYEGLDGGEFRWADVAGKPVVINLWASWCGPCVAEMPDFQTVYERVGDRVGFIGVNHSDSEDAARELAERTGVRYPLVRDPQGTFAVALELAVMPTTVFADAGGRVVGVHPGELSATELQAEIDRLFPG